MKIVSYLFVSSLISYSGLSQEASVSNHQIHINEYTKRFVKEFENNYLNLPNVNSLSTQITSENSSKNYLKKIVKEKYIRRILHIPLLEIADKDIKDLYYSSEYKGDISLFLQALQTGEITTRLKTAGKNSTSDLAEVLAQIYDKIAFYLLNICDSLSSQGVDTLYTRLKIAEIYNLSAHKVLILGGYRLKDLDAKAMLKKNLYEKIVSNRKKMNLGKQVVKEDIIIPEFKNVIAKILTTREIRILSGGRKLLDDMSQYLTGLRGGVPKKLVSDKLSDILTETVAKHVLDSFIGPTIKPVYISKEFLTNKFPNIPKDDIEKIFEIFNKYSSEAGSVMFLGGASGAGKSSTLRRFSFNDKDALSPDPIKAILRHSQNPNQLALADENVHLQASAINAVIREIFNNMFARSYVADATLSELGDVKNALEAGKRVTIQFHIVPPELSLLRVLKRNPSGSDPVMPIESVLRIYQGTLNSARELWHLKESRQWQEQLRVDFWGPKYLPEIGIVESEGNISWTVKETLEHLSRFEKDVAKYSSPSTPFIREMLGDGKNKPDFISLTEWHQMLANPFIIEYWDLPLKEAYRKHILRK